MKNIKGNKKILKLVEFFSGDSNNKKIDELD
jgi:hypothetical protein